MTDGHEEIVFEMKRFFSQSAVLSWGVVVSFRRVMLGTEFV